MSGSNIGDGIVTTLTSASAFDSTNVSKVNYRILETTGACAIVVQPASIATEGHAYGRTWAVTWSIAVEGYIRDVGNPKVTLANLWKFPDEVMAAIKSDQSLNSSACGAIVRSGEHASNVFIEAGGQVWLPFNFIVEAIEVM